MQIDDETLMAFADGALEPDQAARVAAGVAADPALQAQLERHRALRTQLASAFDDVLDEAVPARLQAAARGPAAGTAVSDIGAAAARRAVRAPRRWAWPEWGAMAASVLLGIVLAQWLPGREARDGVLVAGVDGHLRARAQLADALDTQLASAPEAGPFQLGISFRALDGGYCRSFVLKRERALAGLACRDRNGWQVPVVADATATVPDGELRLASTPLPAAVLAEVEARVDGEPLDADGERSARDAGWR